MKPILIGLAGLARSGKSTVADHLERVHMLEQYAFADPLRTGLMEIFNLDAEDFEGDSKEQELAWLGKSPRQLMQSMGTEWGRQMVHPDVWLKIAEQNLNYMQNALTSVIGFVVSDVRFKNEADFIRRRGGVIIHIRRTEAPPVSPHISEAGIELQPDDLLLNNTESISHLKVKVDQLLEGIRNRTQRTAA